MRCSDNLRLEHRYQCGSEPASESILGSQLRHPPSTAYSSRNPAPPFCAQILPALTLHRIARNAQAQAKPTVAGPRAIESGERQKDPLQVRSVHTAALILQPQVPELAIPPPIEPYDSTRLPANAEWRCGAKCFPALAPGY